MNIFTSITNPLLKLCSWYFTRKALPYWTILLGDCVILYVSFIVAHAVNTGMIPTMLEILPLSVAIWTYMICFIIGFRTFHTYSGILRYSSFVDLGRISFAMVMGSVLVMFLRIVFNTDYYLAAVDGRDLMVGSLLTMMAMWFVRMIVKLAFEQRYRYNQRTHIIIFGARAGAASIARNIRQESKSPYFIEGFASADKDLVGHTLQGAPIVDIKNRKALYEFMERRNVTMAFISPLVQDYFLNECQDIIQEYVKTGVKIMMLPREHEWDGKSNLTYKMLQNVSVEDLLPRQKIEVDLKAIGEMLRGKRILITGAAGSIGSEMVRQVAMFAPSSLVLVDQAETPMHDVRRMMSSCYPNIKALTIVGSISNETHMEEIFRDHRPEYVFHAAAYKHVPMMEDNPAMAVQNNVYGTRVIADLAVKYGTRKFVMVSTDKAVNPTNVMGCSKRICEIYCQALNKAVEQHTAPAQHDGSPAVTQFVTTRFGNVLGSNGSVIPIFKNQIQNGGPVTVTHPDIIRYFMLIPEACRLVLEAGTMGHGGEIFVFDMGEPVRIVDLAQRMIDLMGARDVKIEFTGLRPGEKLYEEVLNDAEETKPTTHPKIQVAAVREYPYELALKNEQELYKISFTYDDMAIVKKMKEIVPEYKSRQSKYEKLDK